MPFHAGLDWGGASHAVCIVDGTGRIVARFDVRHDAAGLADMVVRLKRITAPAELPIAIERPSGLIVDALLAAGPPGAPDPSQRGQGLPPALPRGRWQKRCG